MSVFFLGSWRMTRSAGKTNHVNCEAALGQFVFFRATIHSSWTQKKDTHSLYLQCFQQRPLLKFSEKSFKFKIPTVTRPLTSFNVLITAHVIRPNGRTYCWLCSSGIELNNFSRVHWRKYDTIVNIINCNIVSHDCVCPLRMYEETF